MARGAVGPASAAAVLLSLAAAASGPPGCAQVDGGGDATPPLGRDEPSGFAGIVSRSLFESMFPDRNPFYTYEDIVSAAEGYPSFAGTGDLAARKREAAAFLANVAHETGGLVHIEEIAQGDYCAPSQSCPCAPGERYFGRGPLQLSWSYNYCAAGEALGLPLREDPDRVAEDAAVAWRASLWFWTTQAGAGAFTAHEGIVDGHGFGETIRTLNGAIECDGGAPDAVRSRVDRYLRFTQLLGVDPGDDLSC